MMNIYLTSLIIITLCSIGLKLYSFVHDTIKFNFYLFLALCLLQILLATLNYILARKYVGWAKQFANLQVFVLVFLFMESAIVGNAGEAIAVRTLYIPIGLFILAKMSYNQLYFGLSVLSCLTYMIIRTYFV